MTFSKKHRIIIDSCKLGTVAYKWCADNVPTLEWTAVSDENCDSFYFDNEKHVQNFLLVHGGRYYKNGD